MPSSKKKKLRPHPQGMVVATPNSSSVRTFSDLDSLASSTRSLSSQLSSSRPTTPNTSKRSILKSPQSDDNARSSRNLSSSRSLNSSGELGSPTMSTSTRSLSTTATTTPPASSQPQQQQSQPLNFTSASNSASKGKAGASRTAMATMSTPDNNSNSGLPPPPSPLTPSLQSSTQSDILRYSSKILSINVKDINTHKLKGVLEICQSIIKELTSDSLKEPPTSSSPNPQNNNTAVLESEITSLKYSLSSAQTSLSKASEKYSRLKSKNTKLKEEVTRLKDELEEVARKKVKTKNHRTQTEGKTWNNEDESETSEPSSPASRSLHRLKKFHAETSSYRLPSPVKTPEEGNGRFDRHWEEDVFLESVVKVQKCWRGVLNKRVWNDMLEKLMDQEVDLSGLDLTPRSK